MGKNTKPKIIMVEWIDAESHDPWTDLSELDADFPTILSCGILINDGPEGIVLAGNYDSKNEQASCTMKIPHGMIKKLKALKY
jgi:hypothetical protein